MTVQSVEEYLAACDPEQRAALERLRATIRAVVPEATEVISYQIPTFRANGRMLVSYAAFKNHLSLFPLSRAVLADFTEDLRPYLSGKSTIRFQADEPIPEVLVQKLVRARLAENAARGR